MNKKVIYTVVVNGYDKLLAQPLYPGWDYVCFTDGKRIPVAARLGFSRWQIRKFPDWGYDKFRFSRLPKILPHLFLPDYDYSVYIDGNAYLTDDPARILDSCQWPEFVNAHHPFHPDLSTEFEKCIQEGKSDPILLNTQKIGYDQAGMPDDLALMENNLLMRSHMAPRVRTLSEHWWCEMNRVSHRDQLSLPYVCWKLGFEPHMLTQEEKRKIFRTKSHFRSVLSRLIRSAKKRLSSP